MDTSAWRGTGEMFTQGLSVMVGVETPIPQQHLQWLWRAGDSMPAGQSPKLSPFPLTGPTSSWWLLFSVTHMK